jgi:anti-anti-sigma factor
MQGAPTAQTPLAALVQANEGEGALTDRENGLRKDPVLGVESVDGARIIRLGGELDLYNADQVRHALGNACGDSPTRVVVDLGEVEFIDSTALGVLIEARTKLEDRRAFMLAAPGLETRRALQISGLDRHFAVHETVPEALAAKL